MYKFIVYPFLLFILLYAYLDQLSNHMAFTHYYKMKYALNRATHAAAMQIDDFSLAQGIVRIDETAAFDAAKHLLRLNAGDEKYEIIFFEVINDLGESPSIRYINRQWDIDITLNKPAVIIVIEASHPHIMSIKPNYIWKINGTSEVVTSFK